jgi:hypothetical protein
MQTPRNLRITSLLAFTLLPLAGIRADIPAPIPTTFSLTKLASFPKFKFFYTVDPATPPTQLQPIADGQTYRASKNVRLFAQEEGSAAEEFATLKHEYRGKSFALEIRGITREGVLKKTLKVDYGQVAKEPPPFVPNGPVRRPPPPPKSAPTAATPGPLSYFLFAGLSLGAFIAVRRK